MIRSGQPCPRPRCEGHLVAYDSRPVGDARRRYYHCNLCGARPDDNKEVVPLEFFPRRLHLRRRASLRRPRDE